MTLHPLARTPLSVRRDRSRHTLGARWVYVRVHANQGETSSTDFLRRLRAAAPMKIRERLTDNGSRFTDRFTANGKQPSGRHAFDRE